jgi:triphosphoribosyl-dephospho-CoA synthase
MSGPVPRARIAEAYLAACRLEVRTLKPGNVHVFAEGHRMTVADFDRSAEASAPFVSDPDLRVGARIRRAIEATFAAVATNTNLGIVLLCAPLAAAAQSNAPLGASLEQRLAGVLASLDHEDAREVYRAIAHANPAGLGEDSSGDVRAEPPAAWTLLDAMRAAAPRDMIAAEYASGFRQVFAHARAFAAHLAEGAPPSDALALIFLEQLAQHPDTHIVRKHGPGLARRVQMEAARMLAELDAPGVRAIADPQVRARLLRLDADLKSWGANPGSLADLMCAGVFTANLAGLVPEPRQD